MSGDGGYLFVDVGDCAVGSVDQCGFSVNVSQDIRHC